MHLPDRNGAEVLRMVWQVESQARTVLTTSHRAKPAISRDHLAEEGMDAVFFKPFEVPKLLEILERLSLP